MKADRAVTEADLPHRVISDLATMTNGLVPAIALTALAALRTNASRVLDKYQNVIRGMSLGSYLDIRQIGLRCKLCIWQKEDMARAVMASVRDVWYHVTARGIERRTIFSDDKGHVHFLEFLKACSERYAVEIHAYALMGNHWLCVAPHK